MLVLSRKVNQGLTVTTACGERVDIKLLYIGKQAVKVAVSPMDATTQVSRKEATRPIPGRLAVVERKINQGIIVATDSGEQISVDFLYIGKTQIKVGLETADPATRIMRSELLASDEAIKAG